MKSDMIANTPATTIPIPSAIPNPAFRLIVLSIS